MDNTTIIYVVVLVVLVGLYLMRRRGRLSKEDD
jgi:hypothetical protein